MESSGFTPVSLGFDRWRQGDRTARDLSPLQARDALLLKTALEGKDFQTARRELADQADSAPSEVPRPEGPIAPPTAGTEGVFLEITAAEWIHVNADVQTPQGSVHFEATRLTYAHLAITARPGRPPEAQKKDPLVLDLDGRGPATTGAAGARSFDLEGDGRMSPTSFVTGGSAFLALDRNGNGQIDSGLELFGDQHGAANGFEELRKFDDNRDGRIDFHDPVYGQLQLLFGDGRQLPMAEAGIQALSLTTSPVTGSTSGGDDILNQSDATTDGGQTIRTYALGLQRFDQTV